MEKEEDKVEIKEDKVLPIQGEAGASNSMAKCSSTSNTISKTPLKSSNDINTTVHGYFSRSNLVEEFYASVVDGNLSLTKEILMLILELSKETKQLESSSKGNDQGEESYASESPRCDFHTALDVEIMFHMASKGRQFHILQYLLQVLPFDVVTVGPRLLEQALELQNTEIVKSVLDRGVSANERVNGSYIRWGSFVMYTFPIHVAAIAGNISLINILIEYGAMLDMCDTDGNTALMLACAGNHINTVRVLVEAGADLNMTDSNQRTALVISAALNNIDIISLIVEQGGQISERMLLRSCELTSVGANALKLLLKTLPNEGINFDWYRLLNIASSFRKPEIVDVLLNHTPNSLKVVGLKAQDVLTSALCNKHHGEQIALRLLTERFFDINGKNSGGDYPLHIAVQYCTLSLCSSFISNFGADVNTKDNLERTPLMLCLYRRSLKKDNSSGIEETALSIMRYLIEHGADISCQDNQRRSSLHHAVIQDNHEAVKTLIKGGANISLCDAYRRSILDLFWEETFHLHRPITDLITCILSGLSSNLIEDRMFNFQEILEKKLTVMTTLLKAGATFENQTCQQWVLCTLLHFKLDAYIPLIIGRGIFPQQAIDMDDLTESDIHIGNDISRILGPSISPFSLSLCMHNFDTSLFLYNTWFLTEADIDMLNKNTHMKKHITKRRTTEFGELQRSCKSLFLTPQPLQLLSFVKVSDLIGPRNGRVSRVKESGLPPSMQRKLLYIL